MAFLDQGDFIGVMLYQITANITGSEFLTYLLLLAAFMAILFAFRMPAELSVPLMLPLVLLLMAYSSSFVIIGGLALMYLAVLLVAALAWLR